MSSYSINNSDERTPLLPSSPATPQGTYLTLTMVGLSCMFSAATFAIASSVMPLVKRNYFGGNANAALVQAYFDSASALLSMLVLPVCGSISDAVGRRPFLVLLAVCSVVPWVVLNLFPREILLLIALQSVAYVLTGNKGGAPVLQAVVADISSPSQRAFFLGLLLAFAACGLVFSPISPWLGLTYLQTFWVAAGCVCVSALPLLFIRETLSAEKRKKFSLDTMKSQTPWAALRAVRDHPGLRFCAFISFCAGLPEAGLLETLLFYLNDRFAFTPLQNGILICELGVLMLLTSTVVLKFLLWLTTERNVVLFGLLMNLSHLVAYAVAWDPVIIYFIASPCAALSFVTFPVIASIASQQQPSEMQGTVMGVLGSVKGLTLVFGPLVFGVLYSQFKGPPYDFPQLPMVVGAGLVVMVLGAALWKLENPPRQQQT